MLINGKWMNEPEIKSLITQLIADKSRLESQLSKKRGKWEEVEEYGGWGDTYYRCSICGEEWFLNDGKPKDNNMNFCPKCGADLQEKAGE